MRNLLFVALLASAVASPLAAQDRESPTVTGRQAATLSPGALAEHVLGQIGAQVTSVTRPHYGPGTEMRTVGRPPELTFATTPHATDVTGLCVANLIQVDFSTPRPVGDGEPADTPVIARRVRAMEVYKVVGEIEPYAEVSEARTAEEDRHCAEAGPAIPAHYNDRSRIPFFTYMGGMAPATALLVLQRAIAEAQAGRYRNVRCQAAPAFCRNPAALLARVNLANLVVLDAVPLELFGTRYRIMASVQMPGSAGERDYWTVAVEADLSMQIHAPDQIRSLGRTVLAQAMTSNS